MGFFTNNSLAGLSRVLSLPTVAVLIALAQVSPSFAAEPQPAALPLPGNTPAWATPEADLGRAPEGLRAERMQLLLRRNSLHEAELESYLAQIEDPASPNFHRFLTPEQFGLRFGPTEAELARVNHWLERQGFTLARVNKARTAIEFSATIGQLQQAFHTGIHSYSIRGAQRWSNTADPSVPAEISTLVSGVSSLNDNHPRALSVLGPSATWNEKKRRFAPMLSAKGGANWYLFVTPGDANTIYNAPNSLNNQFKYGHGYWDGTGVRIGVVGNTLVDPNVINDFRVLFNLPTANAFNEVYDGPVSAFNPSADNTEALIDAELAGALAPGAQVTYYAAADTLLQSGVLLAINRALDDNVVSILNVSFGQCEASLGAAGNLQILNLWKQAAAQGITVVVAAGDSGPAGCDNPDTQTSAAGGLAVNGLASTPYNIAVGGTDFDVIASNFAGYVGLTNSSNLTSAKGYIPEKPWNDSTSVKNALSTNQPQTGPGGNTNILAASGGPSTRGAVGANNVLGPYAKPSWQKLLAASNTDAVRDMPDVSLLAGDGAYRAVWTICRDTTCANSSPTIYGVGGTSASAAAFAGMLAVVSQSQGSGKRLGQADWVLYRMAQSAPAVFHAVTNGNNSVYCASGSTGCGANRFLSGFNAAATYNMATGLGSVDMTQMVNHWNDVPLAASTTTLSLDRTTLVHGTAVKFTATVTPSAATGLVAIVNSSGSVAKANRGGGNTVITLSAGSGSTSFNQLPGGTYHVSANYGGDGVYAPSVSKPVTVTVSPEASLVRITALARNSQGNWVNAVGTTWPLGTQFSLHAQPIGLSQSSASSPITNATGNVTFLDGTASRQTTMLDSSGSVEWNFSSFTAGTHSITASYAGDPSYQASVSAKLAISIAKIPTTAAVTGDNATLFRDNETLTATISANLPQGQLSLGGTVTFTDLANKAVLGTAALSSGCTGITTVCSTASLQLPVRQFENGANSISVAYSGDSNFQASTSSTPFLITCTAGCDSGSSQWILLFFTGYSPSNQKIVHGDKLTAQVNLAWGGGFSGAVNLTCKVVPKHSTDAGNPTCSLSPSQVTTVNWQNQATITIQTTSATTQDLYQPYVYAVDAATGKITALNLFNVNVVYYNW